MIIASGRTLRLLRARPSQLGAELYNSRLAPPPPPGSQCGDICNGKASDSIWWTHHKDDAALGVEIPTRSRGPS
jgi:hypothetical protein